MTDDKVKQKAIEAVADIYGDCLLLRLCWFVSCRAWILILLFDQTTQFVWLFAETGVPILAPFAYSSICTSLR
jgi:hypothetical protein